MELYFVHSQAKAIANIAAFVVYLLIVRKGTGRFVKKNHTKLKPLHLMEGFQTLKLRIHFVNLQHEALQEKV